MEKKLCLQDDQAIWVLDRIESAYGILENACTLTPQAVPVKELPEGVRPGDSLCCIQGQWQVNLAHTRARNARIQNLFDRIKSKS